MFGWGPATKVYLAAGATDMRKGFDGLYALVRDRLQLEPLSGHVFLFSNAQRNRLKLIYLGRQRAMGMRQAAGEGAFSLAGGREWANQGGAQSRRNGAAAGRHRLGGKPASGVVSEDRRRRERSVTNRGNMRWIIKHNRI